MEQLPNLPQPAPGPAKSSGAPSAKDSTSSSQGDSFDQHLAKQAPRDAGRPDNRSSGEDPARPNQSDQGDRRSAEADGDRRKAAADDAKAAQAATGSDSLKEARQTLRNAEDPETRFQALLRLLKGGESVDKLAQLLNQGDGSGAKEMLSRLQQALQKNGGGPEAGGDGAQPGGGDLLALMQQLQQALTQRMEAAGLGPMQQQAQAQAASGKAAATAAGASGIQAVLGQLGMGQSGMGQQGQNPNSHAFHYQTLANGASGGDGRPGMLGQGATLQSLLQPVAGQGSNASGQGQSPLLASRDASGFAEALRGEQSRLGGEGREATLTRTDAASGNATQSTSHLPERSRGPGGTRLVQGEHTLQKATVKLAQEASDGQRDVRLKLNPPHLGQMRVELQMSDNRVNMVIHMDNRAAAQQLGDQLQNLRQAFQDQDLNLEDVQVEVGSDQDGQAQEDQSDFMAGNGSGGEGTNGPHGGQGDDDDGAAEADGQTIGLANDSLSLYA